ncbi:glycosyltransferase family 4 protein [Photobacterium sanctipauli]|uniref:Glycosyltransferase family 4 protein n=1 Tax=Photobacterium sanctipauli TaxID=1342794 RepID=A0A2T3NY84_9GAMM|nr:glycosyltransferase [Photobacterium sanctipauli]PSW21210.1 glycosyltransferase family 4 protein [Photobacterium sanctipauli]
MKLLTISTLYPNAADPKHGIFVETRLRQLKKKYPDVKVTVIAPVPWFPFKHERFGQYAKFASVPYFEHRHDIAIYHPRYVVLPKIGMNITPITLQACLNRQIKLLVRHGFKFDLIDGHYYFPDGVAIAAVAKQWNKPFTVTARGTDINLIPQFKKPLKDIKQVFQQSNHNLAVCEALRQEMILHGAVPSTVTTSRNGVDLTLFRFTAKNEQQQLRQKLKLPLDKKLLISVGLLTERKGQSLTIDALKNHPDAHLLLAGTGPDRKALESQIAANNLGQQVTFLGGLEQARLADYFGACDASILASNREGWANVLLESMACGTPVIATNIWGTPEIVKSPEAGLLIDRSSDAISNGISQLFNALPNRDATRRYAEQYSWDETSTQLYNLFIGILSRTNPIYRQAAVDKEIVL